MDKPKWADYLIVAVRYDSSSRIVIVKCRPDLERVVGAEVIQTRTEIMDNIRKGKSYVTATEGPPKTWTKGADVHIVPVNGIDYIRTDRNETTKDNLGNLPEF